MGVDPSLFSHELMAGAKESVQRSVNKIRQSPGNFADYHTMLLSPLAVLKHAWKKVTRDKVCRPNELQVLRRQIDVRRMVCRWWEVCPPCGRGPDD